LSSRPTASSFQPKCQSTLHERFLQQGQYLRNWSPTTLRTYRQGLNTLSTIGPEEVPTKADLEAWVIGLRQQGLTPGGCNMYIRTVNSYLSWLKEEGRLPTPLRVKLLRAPLRQHTLLSPADLKVILLFKPKSLVERRTRTLIMLLLDTGIRITEALTLERKKINLDDLLLTVWGKGNKERVVPFSLELRPTLFRWLSSAPASPFVFSTRSGTRLTYRNAFREIQQLCERAGVQTHCHPHLFRHQFAANYIRQGGDIYRLSRFLGHTAITTTQIYLRSLGVEDLQTAGERRLTPLRL
jgi:site-specific recombinase XerD